MPLALSRRAVKRALFMGLAVVALAGLFAEFAKLVLRWPDAGVLVDAFSLSDEGNLPTWYVGSILLVAAVLLMLCASVARQRGAGFVMRWRLLAALFLYISLDEFVTIHENANAWFDFDGVLTFGWILPASAALLVLACIYAGFLAHLPSRTRRAFVLAGGLYVGGAVLMELPLGWWIDTHGSQNMGYALIDWVEEVLELSGASLFVLALLDHLFGDGGRLEIAWRDGPARSRREQAPRRGRPLDAVLPPPRLTPPGGR